MKSISDCSPIETMNVNDINDDDFESTRDKSITDTNDNEEKISVIASSHTNLSIMYERMITQLQSEVTFLRNQLQNKENHYREELEFLRSQLNSCTVRPVIHDDAGLGKKNIHQIEAPKPPERRSLPLELSSNLNEESNNSDNKFDPSNITRRKKPAANLKQQENAGRRIVPGRKSYSEVVCSNNDTKKVVKIFSDSIPKNLRMNEFNKYMAVGKAEMNAHPGATTTKLHEKVFESLEKENTGAVLLHVGVNDILNGAEDEIVINNIMNIGITCRDHGVEEIFISSIIYSAKIDMRTLNSINKQIQERCIHYGFIFVNNNNINFTNLWMDGIHLDDHGKTILANNFLRFFNTFLFQKTWIPFVKW